MSAAACFMIDGECFSLFHTLQRSLCSPQWWAHNRFVRLPIVSFQHPWSWRGTSVSSWTAWWALSSLCWRRTSASSLPSTEGYQGQLPNFHQTSNNLWLEGAFSCCLISVLVQFQFILFHHFISLLGVFDMSTLASINKVIIVDKQESPTARPAFTLSHCQ